MTKKDIIERLFKDGHIDFNEMWILLQDSDGAKFIPLPYPIYPSYPTPPYQSPYWFSTTGTGTLTSELQTSNKNLGEV